MINRLTASELAYQQVFFPLITQGPGAFPLGQDSFVLKLSIYIETNMPNQNILRLIGHITEDKDSTLATLLIQSNQLFWVCPVSADHDCLFDAVETVKLKGTALRVGEWVNCYTLVIPNAYQQTFGWKKAANTPLDPRKTTVGSMARQLSPAGWNLSKIEIQKLNGAFIGSIELLPADADTTPAQNIRKGHQ